MDATHFDALARKLVSPDTRRGVLALLLGGGLGSLALTESVARKSGACQPACGECQFCQKGKCKKKHGHKRCQPGTCQPTADGTACGSGGQVCQSGQCTCPSSTTRCGEICVTTATDPRNCGGCGARCQLNASCSAGTCGCVKSTCMIPGATCCPASAMFPCLCGIANGVAFIDPTTCGALMACPAGTTTCVGPQCQTCCPAGSTCEPSTGACLQ